MREERPISRLQHLRDPNRNTHRCWGATVGDSPKGPLNNQKETRLKPAKNANANQLTHLTRIHSTTTIQVAPTARQDNTADAPLSEVRLARGVDAPLGKVRPARGPYAPSGGARLARGLNHTPRTKSASFEGWAPPRAGPAPLKGTRAHLSRAPAHTCSRTRVRAFNALTQQVVPLL
jgi:hypothetical protein